MNFIDFIDLQEWCREYNRADKYKHTALERFVVAQYQIHQALQWRDEVANRSESMASTCLHLIMLAEMMKLDIIIDFNHDFNKRTRDYQDWRVIASHLTGLAQQVMYYHRQSSTMSRRTRYNKERAATFCLQLIYFFAAELPDQAFTDAINNLKGL